MLRSTILFAILTSLTIISTPWAQAQQFVYQPKNPAFGGSFLNYQWMLSSAQAQKGYEEDADRFGSIFDDPLDDFQGNLQRQILNQLSREIVSARFGDDLDLTQEGLYDLGDFSIEIVPGSNGVSIRVFNDLTGDESIITIPSF